MNTLKYIESYRNFILEFDASIKYHFFFGGNRYFVEHQAYSPTDEHMMNEYVNTAAGTLVEGFTDKLIGRGIRTITTEGKYINLASSRRTAHIITGDATGGGHARFGSLKSFRNGLTGSKYVSC
ncbi:hypothetical protein [Chryseobacterium potabilaquae]|uniref:Uncharacterized protein n=1 Tax=Chryseobacterium potabilaquae TaxID=2675057 RepID=A0A6N4X4X8_9FLAO|nr:hypothetical protein [Chryseobacterium potabilaquae]CAA7193824.1 hypothetical protein CHRY9293_00235 [Chryseobacterium potabilaquae]